jgi:site-specific DNA-cytosine methylase
MGDNQAAVAYSIREDAKANNFSATPLHVTPALQALRPSVQSHHAQTFIVDRAAFNQGENAQYEPRIEESDTMSTLVARGPHAVAQSFNVNARPDEMKLETEISGTLTSSQNAGLFQDMAVRRLTPVECERLQGFPDNYTQIPWGKGDTPDSHRYKAMGNSMAVPCMQWIGDRIQKVENGLL